MMEIVIISLVCQSVLAGVVCVGILFKVVRDEIHFRRHRQMTELDRIVNGR